MGLQNVGKLSHFGMAVLRRGWGLKKKRPLAILRDKGGNGRCPLSLMKTMTFTMNLDCLNHRPSVDHVKMSKFLVSHGIQIFIIFL